MDRRAFLKAGAVAGAACVIPLSIPRDAIANALFGTPEKANLNNLCDVAMKFLNDQLRGKVAVLKRGDNKGKGWKRKHVAFEYNADTSKLPLAEVVDLHIKPAIQLLSDSILEDAKRGRIFMGKLELPEEINGVNGELGNIMLRLINHYDITTDTYPTRIDIGYST